MFDFNQSLREFVLKSSEGKPVQVRCDNLNMIEAIIEGEMDIPDLVQAIGDGTLPVRYRPLKSELDTPA